MTFTLLKITAFLEQLEPFSELPSGKEKKKINAGCSHKTQSATLLLLSKGNDRGSLFPPIISSNTFYSQKGRPGNLIVVTSSTACLSTEPWDDCWARIPNTPLCSGDVYPWFKLCQTQGSPLIGLRSWLSIEQLGRFYPHFHPSAARPVVVWSWTVNRK